MAFTLIQKAEILIAMEAFLEFKRPPEEIRDKLDLQYKIEKQSIIIYELRPRFNKPSEIMEIDIAKATWVNTQQCWKVFWKRADLKWHAFETEKPIKTINEFTTLVANDSYGCFFG